MSVKESYAGKINRKLNKKLRVIAVAAGREPADLVLKNATYVNVFSNELCHGDIAVAEGLIVGMGEYSGAVEVDVSGKIVLPGFVDAHIHLESSLVSPTEFAKAVLPHGTTTARDITPPPSTVPCVRPVKRPAWPVQTSPNSFSGWPPSGTMRWSWLWPPPTACRWRTEVSTCC